MQIEVLASSSSGNAYIIRNEAHTLLVEAGLPFREIKSKLLRATPHVILTKLDAVLVTHQHGDHSQSARDLSMWAPIIATTPTLDAAKVRYRRWPIADWETIEIGTFTITAFTVEHDCEGAIGFIINDTLEHETLLFINDTKYVKWDLSGNKFDHIMIECNHNDEKLDLTDERSKRLANSHMSMKTTLLTLSKLDMANVKDIYLMHLSDGNSDENKMLEAVAKQTGKVVYSCQKNGGVREYHGSL